MSFDYSKETQVSSNFFEECEIESLSIDELRDQLKIRGIFECKVSLSLQRIPGIGDNFLLAPQLLETTPLLFEGLHPCLENIGAFLKEPLVDSMAPVALAGSSRNSTKKNLGFDITKIRSAILTIVEPEPDSHVYTLIYDEPLTINPQLLESNVKTPLPPLSVNRNNSQLLGVVKFFSVEGSELAIMMGSENKIHWATSFGSKLLVPDNPNFLRNFAAGNDPFALFLDSSAELEELGFANNAEGFNHQRDVFGFVIPFVRPEESQWDLEIFAGIRDLMVVPKKDWNQYFQSLTGSRRSQASLNSKWVH